MMQAMSPRPGAATRTLAGVAMLLAIGTVVAVVGLLHALIPVEPGWYLGALALATLLAAAAVWQTRHWLTIMSFAVCALLLGAASFFHFVAGRVPAGTSAFVVGQPAPDFTLPDAEGRPVHLAGYRGQRPVVLVFYRGYW